MRNITIENIFCIMNGLKVERRWLIAIYHLTTSISSFFFFNFFRRNSNTDLIP